MKHRGLVWALALVTTFLDSGCAFYPKKSDDFDRPTCEVYRNPLTLDVAPLAFNCEGDSDVRGCLLAYSAIGPATMALSGSIVLTGDSSYWLANRSYCSIKAYARRHSKIASH